MVLIGLGCPKILLGQLNGIIVIESQYLLFLIFFFGFFFGQIKKIPD